MSVLFLPPPSASAVPDASETVSGKIRIATSTEATTGTNDLTAMTPAKVKTVVDAAVVGGVTYKGTFDTSSPADLSNALKGDLYVISVAGTYQSVVWAVGDHLLINDDMGGSISPSKIDKVDNSDAVTSVAGKTGAVTLVPSDITGLSTVASTGAYSDLSGTPTLATVATTGAYSDLSGTPSLATVATTGAYSDLSGTPTNVSAFTNDSGYLTSAPVDSVAGKTGSVTLDLDDLSDVTIASVSAGETIVYNGTLSAFQNATISGGAAQTVYENVSTATASAVDSQENHAFFLNYSTGPITLSNTANGKGATVTLFNNDSASTRTVTGPTFKDAKGNTVTSVTLAPNERRVYYLWPLGTAVWLHVNTTFIETCGDVSLSSPSGGDALIYNGTLSAFQNSALATVATTGAYSDLSGTPTLATVATTGAYSDLTGTPTLGTAAALDVGTSASNVVQLDGSARLPAVDGSQLTNLPSGASTLGALTDVDVTGVANTNVIKYNSTSGEWEDGAVAYSEVTGTPSLATVATTGAYSDLSGTPTLGTAAALDVGTSANNVVQLDGSARLPAVDGSQLTGLPSAGIPNVTSATPGATYSITTSTSLMEVYLLTPSVACAVTIPTASSAGSGYRYNIKNNSTYTITISPSSGTIDTAANFSLPVQFSNVTLVSDGSNWFVL